MKEMHKMKSYPVNIEESYQSDGSFFSSFGAFRSS